MMCELELKRALLTMALTSGADASIHACTQAPEDGTLNIHHDMN